MPDASATPISVRVYFRDRTWQVLVPRWLCEPTTTRIPELLRLVCDGDQTHEAQHLTVTLKLFTFDKSPWDAVNIVALVQQKAIFLAENAQEHHLASVFAYLCEFIENAVRALRGASETEKLMEVRLYLPSHAQGMASATGNESQDYIAFRDTGDGMVVDSIKAYTTLAAAPQELVDLMDPAAVAAYLADGNFSCFGVGGKHAAFLMGASVLAMTRANDPDAETHVWRMSKADLIQQEQTAAGTFHVDVTTRLPHTHTCFTPAECANEDLMETVRKFDDQPHGSLFVITDLDSCVKQLTAKSFQTLHTYLTGTYFYLCVPGNVPPIGNEPAKPARANFMYGPGYKYGPIKFSVSAVGFSVDGPDNPLEEQTYRLGTKPWPTWPESPPSEADKKGDDVMHTLAKIMNRSCFTHRINNVPQIHGSKFVMGIKIPGVGSEKGAYAIIYCHYCPPIEGKESVEELRLPPNVRWLPHWKGRLMQYPDLTALLPVMRHGFSAPEYKALVEKRVVMQMFLPGVVCVDHFKTRFVRPLNDQLENLPDDCYFRVDEDRLYTTPACGTDLSAGASADAPLPPGFSKMRKVELEKNFPIWVKKASQEFDDQWAVRDEIHPADLAPGWEAFEVLEAKHKGAVFRKDQHMVVRQLGGGALSWYRQPNTRTKTQSKFVGKVAYFKRPIGSGMADVKAMLTREPTRCYGNELFEFSSFKLEQADDRTVRDEAKRASEALPHSIDILFANPVETSRRLEDGAPDRPMEFVANTTLPAATVYIRSKPESKSRPGSLLVEWTNARDTDKSSTKALSVTQTVYHDDGPEKGEAVGFAKADLKEQNGEECFVLQGTQLQLPRPGSFKAVFTATVINRGGPDFQVEKSKTLYYKAKSGDVHSCAIGGLPDTLQLGATLDSVYVQLRDEHGNLCRLLKVPQVTLLSDCLSTEAPPVWSEPQTGQHQLRLPTVSVKAGPSLKQSAFTAADQPASLSCTVVVNGMSGRTEVLVQQELTVKLLPGPPAKLALQPLPDWFDATTTLALANHSTVPQFTLQLLDASDFCTTPFSQGDRASIRLLDDPANTEQSSLGNCQVAFDKHTGAAVFEDLSIDVEAVTQAQSVTFVASYQDQAGVAELSLKAEVQPSTKPHAIRFYLDAELRRQLAEANSGQHVLQHTAGEMVDVLFMTIHSEAGDCLKAPDLQTLRVGRKSIRVEAQANSVFQVHWGTTLKLPDSVRDPKAVEVRVTGKAGWTVTGTLQLNPVSGPAVAWSLRCIDGFTSITNGTDFSEKVVACVVDKLHNVSSLPSNLEQNPPSLTVSYQPVSGREAQSGLQFQRSPHGTAYNGQCLQLQSTAPASTGLAILGPPDRMLMFPDMALLGPPGPIQLTLSSSTTRQLFSPSTLPLELQAGSLTAWRLNKQPAGDVPSHMLFEGMSFTAHDAGDNQLDVPAGQWFVELSATSTRGAVFRSPQKLQPTVNRQSMDLPPVSFTCTDSGPLSLQMVLKRKQKQRVVAQDTKTIDNLNIVLSNQTVTCLTPQFLPATSLTAGDAEPRVRVQVAVEDGSIPRSMQPFVPNFTATVKAPGTDATALTLSQDAEHAASVVSPSRGVLTMAGTYQVNIQYTEANAAVLGLSASEANVKQSMRFEVQAGPATQLGLGVALSPRKCLNAGEPANRMLLAQTTLSILDRYKNVVKHPASMSMMAISTAVINSAGQSVRGLVAIDSGPSSITHISEATGQASIGPLYVEDAPAGSYVLEISASSNSAEARIQSVHLPFEVLDATQKTQAVKEAMSAVNRAQEEFARRNRAAETAQRQLTQAGQTRHEKLADAAEQLHMALDATNWQSVQQHCQTEHQQMVAAPRRPARHRHHLSAQAAQQLKSIDGVIGFISDFVYIESESYARLLSWLEGSLLNVILVRDSASRYRVEDAHIQGLHEARFLLLSKLTPLTDRTSLPHSGTGCRLPGMESVIRMARHVTVAIPADRIPDTTARAAAANKLLYCVAGSTLCMPTERAASCYSEAVFTQLGRGCSPILCEDTGAFITASGPEGGGASNKAPAHLHNLPAYYGQIPCEQTERFQSLTTGLERLQQVASCEAHCQQAQVRCQAADAAVRAARSDLQACQTRLRDAEAQAQQLAQLLESAGVSGMAVTSAAADDTAPVTHGGKRNHAAASASDQTAHSPAQVSHALRNKTARVR